MQAYGVFLEVPYNGRQPFLPYALTDGGPTNISRVGEGHIEIIEMGTVAGDSAKAVTHVTSTTGGPVVPLDCQSITEAWTQSPGNDGYWIVDSTIDMLAPSGGLFGGAAVVNANSGRMYSFDAIAINGFAKKLGNLHQVPGTPLPSLNSGDVKHATVFLNDGTTLTHTFSRGVDAVSFAFMQDSLMNEYIVEEVVGASTEWVITFPTKSFYVDPSVTSSSTALHPFTSVWDGDGACEAVRIDSVYDREEQTYGNPLGTELPPIVSPAPPYESEPTPQPEVSLCFETNVIRFGPPNQMRPSLLGSGTITYVDTSIVSFDAGWMNLNMSEYTDVDGYDKVRRLGGLEGLPVVGFSVSGFTNGTLVDQYGGNVLANYGGIFKHKATRKVHRPR